MRSSTERQIASSGMPVDLQSISASVSRSSAVCVLPGPVRSPALSSVSLPTIQRMEASDGQVRSVVDTLVKVISALEAAGIEIIGENAPSSGAGRGVRLRETESGQQPRRVPSVLFDQTAQDDGS